MPTNMPQNSAENLPEGFQSKFASYTIPLAYAKRCILRACPDI